MHSLDPLNGIINRRPRDPSPAPQPKDGNFKSGSDSREKSEKLMRERSIKTNRRHKFVECLSSQDVNIGMCFFLKKKKELLRMLNPPGELRKLAWAGIPGDLRPMAWQLLLVSCP